ncbi:MAG: hypothetical protein AAF361_05280 [Bacteroidota bacterium]
MIAKIIAYELKKRFTSWITLLFFAMLIFQGFWYTKGYFDYYPNDGLLMNATAIGYMNLAACGMLMIIIVAIVTGTTLHKDLQFGTGQWIYALPVKEKSFYIGRFLSSFLFNVLLALGYVLGIALLPYGGIGEAERFGAIPWGQILQGFFLLTVPNLFLLTSLFFLALVFTRRLAAGYLAVFGTVIAFLLMQTVSEASGMTATLAICDPFGYVATDGVTGAMTLTERNFGYLPFEGYLVTNRILWFSIALLAFLLSYFKFSFKWFGNKAGSGKKTLKDVHAIYAEKPKPTLIPKLSFTTSDFVKKLWSLAKLEFRNITRPLSFKMIIGIIVLMEILQFLMWNASFYIGPTMPLTSTMTLFRLSFGVFIMMLIIIWSGELFFKDRVVKISAITDALPVPVWVTQFSRFLALAGMAFILAFTFMAVGIIVQLLKGGAPLMEIDLFVYDMLGYNWGWLTYVLWIAVVFFVAGLTGNRFLTHILSVGAFLLVIMAFELGLAEQVIFAYGAVPGLEDYSEISGYGIWYTSAIWYFLMWTAAAIALILLGIYLWHRGTGVNWSSLLRLRGKQLNPIGKIAVVLSIAAFFVIQSIIIRNVNKEGNFIKGDVSEKQDADYEKAYGYLAEKAHPRYAHMDLQFDFYPNERKASYQADLLLTNPTDQRIDTLFLNTKHAADIISISQNGNELKMVKRDSIQHITAYAFSKPMLSNDSAVIQLKMKKHYKGFTQSGGEPQADLMANGSFGAIHEYLPVIGYDPDRELDENRVRSEYGLPKWDSRYPSVNDKRGLVENPFASDADRVTANITISTSSDQIPFAPGKLVSSSRENGRSKRTYAVASPSYFNWQLGSAAAKEHDFEEGKTKISIFASPKHPFNVKQYGHAVKTGIKYLNQEFGGYPYEQVSLLETPYYQGEFFAYPYSIAISEREGWYADTTAMKERGYIFQSTLTQLAKHWVQDRMQIANVQGAEMLSVALPESIGLQILREEMGDEALELVLQKKQDYVGLHQANEPNKEPALIYSDGADYLEPHKGAIALNQIQRVIGREKFNTVVLNFINEEPEKPKVFIDLYQKLLREVPISQKDKVRQMFEVVASVEALAAGI